MRPETIMELGGRLRMRSRLNRFPAQATSSTGDIAVATKLDKICLEKPAEHGFQQNAEINFAQPSAIPDWMQ